MNKQAKNSPTKALALAVKNRLGDLGHDVPLGHAYEVLATVGGHKTWAVASAAAPSPSSAGEPLVEALCENDLHVFGEVLVERCKSADVAIRALVRSVMVKAHAMYRAGVVDPVAIDLRDLFDLGKIQLFAQDSDEAGKRLRHYLEALPNYDAHRGDKQNSLTVTAHNRFVLYVSEGLASGGLSDFVRRRAERRREKFAA